MKKIRKKKALIIGSEGNIGKKLSAFLKDEGYLVKGIDLKPGWKKDFFVGDINFPIDILPAFEWKPDFVFLLAAMVSRVTCEQASGRAVVTNLSGVQNTIILCKKFNSKLIYFSTSEVYGPHTGIMKENKPSLNPNNTYGLTKLLSEKLIEYEVKFNNLNALILRPFMIYDEDEEPGDHRSAIIRFAVNLFNNKKIEVHNNTSRGWLHIKDAVRAIESTTRVQKFQIVNLGNPDFRSIKCLAEMIRKEIGAKEELVKFIDLPNKMTPIKKPCLENQKKFLKFKPKITLEDGIKLVCNKIKNTHSS